MLSELSINIIVFKRAFFYLSGNRLAKIRLNSLLFYLYACSGDLF